MVKSHFVHLHVHSEYSISDGLITVDQMIHSAKQDNMTAVGLTDLHNTYASVKFYRRAMQEGIKPILGVEVRIIDDMIEEESQSTSAKIGVNMQPKTRYNLLLYCQNQQGYLNICQLLTRSYQEGQVLGVAYIARSWLNKESVSGLVSEFKS